MKTLLYFLIFFVLGINGALCLAWFLSPPSPDRIGFWYIIFFFIHPFLGALGLTSLILKKSLNLSWWLGSLLLLYVGGWGIFMILSGIGLFSWLPANFSFEVIYSYTLILTLIGLIIVIYLSTK